MSVTAADVAAARERLAGRLVATPCLQSQTLSDITGAEIWLKFENLQYTAAFKERGALNRLAQLTPAQAAKGVIAMSAGNHAQGVAYHARRLGIPATIVMPRHTPFVKVENTRRFGARVLLEGEGVEEAAIHAWGIAERDGLTFVHPFDAPAVIAGQGTVALEMLEVAPDLEVLVVPIGGGGLISGIAIAARAVSPGIEIVGGEAALYPSVYRRLRGLPALAGGPTIAEGIAVKEPGNLTYPVIERLVSEVLLVEEAAIEAAVLQLLEIEKTVAEGAGAAGLAAVMSHPDRFRGRKVGLVLCGGNIDSRLLSAVILRGLVRTQRLVRLRIGVPDTPGSLVKIASIIAERGGNVVDVGHQRAFSKLSVKLADVDFTIETRSAEHAGEIAAALQAADFQVGRIDEGGQVGL